MNEGTGRLQNQTQLLFEHLMISIDPRCSGLDGLQRESLRTCKAAWDLGVRACAKSARTSFAQIGVYLRISLPSSWLKRLSCLDFLSAP